MGAIPGSAMFLLCLLRIYFETSLQIILLKGWPCTPLKGILLFSMNTCVNSVLWSVRLSVSGRSQHRHVNCVGKSFDFSSKKTLRLCVRLAYSEYYNAVAVSVERLLASVCLGNNLSCLCSRGFYLSGTNVQLGSVAGGTAPALRQMAGARDPPVHVPCLPQLYFQEVVSSPTLHFLWLCCYWYQVKCLRC